MNSEYEKQSEQQNAHKEDAPDEVRQFVPCEAALTAISLCLIAYVCARFFSLHWRLEFRDEQGPLPYITYLDAMGVYLGFWIALFSIPIVLIGAAWNASYHGYNHVRNRVLIYLIVMFATLAIDLLIIFVAGCWMNLL